MPPKKLRTNKGLDIVLPPEKTKMAIDQDTIPPQPNQTGMNIDWDTTKTPDNRIQDLLLSITSKSNQAQAQLLQNVIRMVTFLESTINELREEIRSLKQENAKLMEPRSHPQLHHPLPPKPKSWAQAAQTPFAPRQPANLPPRPHQPIKS